MSKLHDTGSIHDGAGVLHTKHRWRKPVIYNCLIMCLYLPAWLLQSSVAGLWYLAPMQWRGSARVAGRTAAATQ